VFFNMTKGPFFDNLKLREALSLTVDREVLVTKVSPRGQQPAYGLVPPTVPDYTSQPLFFKDMSKEERLTLARKLYAEAGYGPQNPAKFSLLYTTDEELRVFLLAIASMWKSALGVEVKLENREWQVFLNAVRQKDYDIGIMGTIATYADAEGFFDNYRSDAGFYNHSGYSSPAFDSLLAKSKQATDMAVRRDLLQQAERLLMTDMPIIPIQFGAINRLVSTRISGWRDGISYPASRYLSIKE
jgi:oligopeptide transport system substrate-binding protein